MTSTSDQITRKPPINLRPILLVVIPFGLGYYLSYLYRTVNIVIAKPLAMDLSLTAADLGFLTSVYFFVFALFQTPLGILLDKYGPKNVQVVLLIFAAVGAILFATSTSFLVLSLARGIIGLGVSGCLMAAIKANVNWFPKERLSLVNGWTATFGTLGALSGTIPVEVLYDEFGWRRIFIILSIITICVVFLIIFFVPKIEKELSEQGKVSYTMQSQFRDLGEIYKNPFFWRMGVIGFIHNSVFLSYQALWMGPWLRDVAGMSLPMVAQTLFWFNVGMLMGVLCIGTLADRLQRIGVDTYIVMGVGIAMSIFIQCLLAMEQTSVAVYLCFGFGFFGSSPLLIWSIFGQRFPAHLVGKVNTAQNMLSFIGAFLVQWGVGAVIGFWPERQGGYYEPVGHQTALVLAIAIELAAFLFFLIPSRRRL